MKLSSFYIPTALMFSSTGFFYIYGWILFIALLLGIHVTFFMICKDAATGKYEWLNKRNPIYGFDRPLTEKEKLWGVSREEIAAFKIRKAFSGRTSLPQSQL